jgi:hypothetical protein
VTAGAGVVNATDEDLADSPLESVKLKFERYSVFQASFYTRRVSCKHPVYKPYTICLALERNNALLLGPQLPHCWGSIIPLSIQLNISEARIILKSADCLFLGQKIMITEHFPWNSHW